MEMDDYLDTDWIGEVREEERAFDRYYVAPMRYINVFFMRVDGGRVGNGDDITSSKQWKTVLLVSSGHMRLTLAKAFTTEECQ